MAEVEMVGMNKVYDNGFHAVHDLDLKVADGEFLVLVGPSGCGKSTALRMIAGLETISGGSLSIDGKVVNDLPSKDRDIAMVFQSYALYPHMTVRDNIGFALKLRKAPKAEIEERVNEAARILELTEWLDRKPGQLSGGQRQRVAMGRAIVRQPKAFLMDEPLSNLDAKLRVQMRSEISRLQKRLKVTTVYVTHDQVEAMTMGDRVAVMSKGVLMQVDSPQRLYDFPSNLFVAAFIGSPQMNIMFGVLEDDGQHTTVRFGTETLVVPSTTLTERPALRNYLGKELAVGIRPEDVYVADPSDPDHSVLNGPVEIREGLGSEVVIHIRLDVRKVNTGNEDDVTDEVGTSLVARLDPRAALREGDQARLRIDTARLHFFDLATGAAIWS